MPELWLLLLSTGHFCWGMQAETTSCNLQSFLISSPISNDSYFISFIKLSYLRANTLSLPETQGGLHRVPKQRPIRTVTRLIQLSFSKVAASYAFRPCPGTMGQGKQSPHTSLSTGRVALLQSLDRLFLLWIWTAILSTARQLSSNWRLEQGFLNAVASWGMSLQYGKNDPTRKHQQWIFINNTALHSIGKWCCSTQHIVSI